MADTRARIRAPPASDAYSTIRLDCLPGAERVLLANADGCTVSSDSYALRNGDELAHQYLPPAPPPPPPPALNCTADFLRRADAGCADPDGSLPSPVIPHGYDRVARWQMEEPDPTRGQQPT